MRVIGGDKAVEKNLFGEIVDPQMKMLDVMFTNTGGNLDIEKIERDYFDEHDAQKKEAIRTQVDDFEKNFIRGELDKQDQAVRQQAKRLKARAVGNKLSARDEKKFQTLETELARLKAAKEKLAAIQPGEKPYFLWQLYFMDVFKNGGFDIVIGNPPYVQIQKLPEEAKEQLKKQGYNTFAKTADLYCLFYERGLNILRPEGVLTFISSNKFFRAGYGESLRRLLNEAKEIQTIIDFGEFPVFAAGTDPCILLAVNKVPNIGKISAVVVKDVSGIQNVRWTLERIGFELDRSALNADGWTLEGTGVMALLGKIRAAGNPLGEHVNGKFYYGIKTGFNEAFVIDRATRDQLISEDKKSAELIKPWLRGQDIKRWYADYQDLYVINIQSGSNAQWLWTGKDAGKAEAIFKKEYPAIFNHLKQHKKKLMARDDQGQYYWELRSCAYNDEFEQPKIVYADIAKLMRASYDTEGMFCANTMYILPTDSLFLLGYLNGQLFDWYARNTFQSLGDPWKGGRLRYIAQYMEKVPVPAATPAQQKEIEALVEQILALKKRNPDADVSALEAEIDQLVYKLYSLTPAEIKIIEGND
jgi:hypothetical protein